MMGNPAVPGVLTPANLAAEGLFLIFCLDGYLALFFLERATLSVFGRWSLRFYWPSGVRGRFLEVFFRWFFAVFYIGRIDSSQKLKVRLSNVSIGSIP